MIELEGFRGARATSKEQLEYLQRLASQVRDGVIVEIGSLFGASACAMAMVAQVPIYCIDVWDLIYPGDFRLQHGYYRNKMKKLIKGQLSFYKQFQENVETFGVADKITSINAQSQEVAKIWDKPIGLLYIDGDHSYQGCMGDYMGFAKHIIARGFLAIHDYDEKHPGVMQAVKEIMESGLWIDWEQEGKLISARRAA